MNKSKILKHRLHLNSLPSTYNLLDHSIDNIEKMLTSVQSTTVDKNTLKTLSSRRLKKIGQFKYDMLTLTVSTGEELVRSINKEIQEEKKIFFTIGSNNENNPLSSSSEALVQLMAAIETRQAHMIQRAQIYDKSKVTFFFRRSSGDFQRTGKQQHRRRSKLMNINNNNMFLSLPIVDVVLPLSSEQLAFFDYGLKYVPPCQSRFSRRPIDEIIEQEYKKLKQRISDNLFNYCMTASDQRAIDHFASMKQLTSTTLYYTIIS